MLGVVELGVRVWDDLGVFGEAKKAVIWLCLLTSGDRPFLTRRDIGDGGGRSRKCER